MAEASVDERRPSTVQLYDDEKLSNDDETEVSTADRQRFKPSEVQQQEQKLTDGQQKCKASRSTWIHNIQIMIIAITSHSHVLALSRLAILL